MRRMGFRGCVSAVLLATWGLVALPAQADSDAQASLQEAVQQVSRNPEATVPAEGATGAEGGPDSFSAQSQLSPEVTAENPAQLARLSVSPASVLDQVVDAPPHLSWIWKLLAWFVAALSAIAAWVWWSRRPAWPPEWQVSELPAAVSGFFRRAPAGMHGWRLSRIEELPHDALPQCWQNTVSVERDEVIDLESEDQRLNPPGQRRPPRGGAAGRSRWSATQDRMYSAE